MIINSNHKGGGGSADVVIITDQTVQVSGEDCPSLTVAQVETAYNAIVAGKSVTISHVDGQGNYEKHYRPVVGDGVSNPSILIMLGWKGFLDYQVTANNTVAITLHPISQHQITNVVVGTDAIDITIS